VITFGSVPGAVVYWIFLTLFGVLLGGGALLERRRRGRPIQRWHIAAAMLTLLGFAALGYTGAWRAFYSLERTRAGFALTYHWPTRQVVVPWDSIAAVSTAPGYKGQRPVRVVARDGRQHLSAMISAHEALRLSRCLSGDVARRRGEPPPAGGSSDDCP
jgi:hypothetical protein